MAVKGGNKLKRAIRKGKQAKGVKSVEVGFFASAKYPSGCSGNKRGASIHNFGAPKAGIPARPFFTLAIERIRAGEVDKVLASIDPQSMVVTDSIADLIGEETQAIIKEEITNLRTPPLKPATIERRKKKSSNPLVDTSVLISAVVWKVNR